MSTARKPHPLVALFESLDVPREDWSKPSGDVIAFAHSLTVPAGPHVRKPLRLRPFQMQFIRRVYNPRNAHGLRAVRQAILSVARRNGKTLVSAVLVLAHLCGPMKVPNSTLISAATTRKQAKLVFRFVKDMVVGNPSLLRHVKVLDSTSRMVHQGDGSVYEAIAADAGPQMGQGIDLCIYDELAQAKNRDLYDALMTSLGSQVEPLMVAISTQAPSDEHLLSELIDYGLKIQDGVIADPAFVVQLHAAPAECDLMDRRAWEMANPALGDYRSEEEMASTMARAVQLPALENSVRVLYLNQRTRAEAAFLSPAVWAKCAAPIIPAIFTDGRRVTGGLDLSARTDLSAICFATLDDAGDVHLWPMIWTPLDTLDARALRDRAPYDGWVRSGFLTAIPGPAIDYDFVAIQMNEAIAPMLGVSEIYFDRWRMDVFKQAMARTGVAANLIPFGQGFKDMSPAVEVFEQLAIEGKLRHGDHPVLRWAISNCVVVTDAANNRKLDKSKSFGRIDPAIAALMAVAALKNAENSMVDIAAMLV